MSESIKTTQHIPFYKLTNLDSLEISERKILKAEDYQLLVTHDEIIQDAKILATKIISQAKAEAHNEKNILISEYNKTRDLIREKNIHHIIHQCQFYYNDVETKLRDTIISIIRKFIINYDADELLLNSIQISLANLAQQKKITLLVANTQYEYILSKLDEIYNEYPIANPILIKKDPSIKRGDCILVTQVGIIESKIEQQLIAIEQSLISHSNNS